MGVGADEAAAWVTVTVWVSDPAVKVTVAVRAVVAVLAPMVSVTLPLLTPLAAESVTHAAEEAAVHDWFEVIAMDFVPPVATSLIVLGVAVNVGVLGVELAA